MTMDIVKAEQI